MGAAGADKYHPVGRKMAAVGPQASASLRSELGSARDID